MSGDMERVATFLDGMEAATRREMNKHGAGTPERAFTQSIADGFASLTVQKRGLSEDNFKALISNPGELKRMGFPENIAKKMSEGMPGLMNGSLSHQAMTRLVGEGMRHDYDIRFAPGAAPGAQGQTHAHEDEELRRAREQARTAGQAGPQPGAQPGAGAGTHEGSTARPSGASGAGPSATAGGGGAGAVPPAHETSSDGEHASRSNKSNKGSPNRSFNQLAGIVSIGAVVLGALGWWAAKEEGKPPPKVYAGVGVDTDASGGASSKASGNYAQYVLSTEMQLAMLLNSEKFYKDKMGLTPMESIQLRTMLGKPEARAAIAKDMETSGNSRLVFEKGKIGQHDVEVLHTKGDLTLVVDGKAHTIPTSDMSRAQLEPTATERKAATAKAGFIKPGSP